MGDPQKQLSTRTAKRVEITLAKKKKKTKQIVFPSFCWSFRPSATSNGGKVQSCWVFQSLLRKQRETHRKRIKWFIFWVRVFLLSLECAGEVGGEKKGEHSFCFLTHPAFTQKQLALFFFLSFSQFHPTNLAEERAGQKKKTGKFYAEQRNTSVLIHSCRLIREDFDRREGLGEMGPIGHQSTTHSFPHTLPRKRHNCWEELKAIEKNGKKKKQRKKYLEILFFFLFSFFLFLEEHLQRAFPQKMHICPLVQRDERGMKEEREREEGNPLSFPPVPFRLLEG